MNFMPFLRCLLKIIQSINPVISLLSLKNPTHTLRVSTTPTFYKK